MYLPLGSHSMPVRAGSSVSPLGAATAPISRSPWPSAWLIHKLSVTVEWIFNVGILRWSHARNGFVFSVRNWKKIARHCGDAPDLMKAYPGGSVRAFFLMGEGGEYFSAYWASLKATVSSVR